MNIELDLDAVLGIGGVEAKPDPIIQVDSAWSPRTRGDFSMGCNKSVWSISNGDDTDAEELRNLLTTADTCDLYEFYKEKES